MQQYLLLLLLLLLTVPSPAQLLSSQRHTTQNYQGRVNSIESFIARFNYAENLEGETRVAAPGADTLPANILLKHRLENLVSTLDEKFLSDPENRKQAKFFSMAVLQRNEPFQLSFHNQNWLAELRLSCLFKGKKDTLTLVLITEKLPDDVERWKLKSAFIGQTSLLDPSAEAQYNFLPNSHGNDFIKLPSLITQQVEAKKTTDALSRAIKNQTLKLEHIAFIQYHFLQVPGWYFKVKEYNRDTSNSGWLIYDLRQLPEEEKSAYLKQHFHIFS